jgi:hypothetical protein
MSIKVETALVHTIIVVVCALLLSGAGTAVYGAVTLLRSL